jgi:hypothetical protein
MWFPTLHKNAKDGAPIFSNFERVLADALDDDGLEDDGGLGLVLAAAGD